MTIYYVDSTATGAADGTSWTDAWTSIGSAVGVAAGDTVYVDDGHSETLSPSTTWTFTNGTESDPIMVISVDKADDSYSAAAADQISGSGGDLSLVGSLQFFGVRFNINDDFTMGSSDRKSNRWDDCYITVGDDWNIGSKNARHRFVNCTLICGNTANTWMLLNTDAIKLEFQGCTITPASAYLISMTSAVDGSNIIYDDCEITGAVTDIVSTLYYSSTILLRRCKLQTAISSQSLIGAFTNPTYGWVRIENSKEGTVSATILGLSAYESQYGTMLGDTARFRTGGADDGENTYSWAMVSSADTLEQFIALESPPMVIWTDDDSGGAITLTVYIAGAADLNDDDFWIEVSSPNESTAATGQFNSTRMAPQGTPTAIARSSGTTWDGAGTGIDGGTGQQKLEVTINPSEPGPVTIRCYLAKPSTTVYVCPKPELT